VFGVGTYITCELDTLSRTGTVDFCQLSTQLLQLLVQNLKQNKNVCKQQNNEQATAAHVFIYNKQGDQLSLRSLAE